MIFQPKTVVSMCLFMAPVLSWPAPRGGAQLFSVYLLCLGVCIDITTLSLLEGQRVFHLVTVWLNGWSHETVFIQSAPLSFTPKDLMHAI